MRTRRMAGVRSGLGCGTAALAVVAGALVLWGSGVGTARAQGTSSAAAQTSDLSPVRSTFIPWVVFRSLTSEDSAGNEVKVTQISVPLSFNLRLSSSLSALLYGAFANTKVEPSGEAASQSVSGPTDMRAKIFYNMAGGTILSLGVSLPTGKHALTTEEEFPAAAAAEDVFGFRIRRFGEGADAEAGLTRAFDAGENGALALGVSYLYKGSFEPTAGSSTKYRPGSEVSVSGGYDYRTASTLARLNLAGRVFTKDQAGGVPAFKQGSQVVLEERWMATLAERVTNDLGARQVIKGKSDSYTNDVNGAVLSGSTENGSSVGLVERLEFETASGLRLAALADGNFYGKTPALYDSAKLFGFGGEIGFAPTERSLLRLQGRVLTGSADPGGIKLSGFDVGASVRAVF